MEENKIPEEGGETAAPKRGFAAWFDNFWYHYKWHSLVALFLVFTVTVCSLQMCKRVDYDINIMYAGGKEISKTHKDGEFAEIEEILSSFKRVTDDFNDDGDVEISILDLFILSNEEIKEAEADKETEVNYSLILNNQKTFNDTVMYSDYYLCFLSDKLYLEYAKTEDGLSVFAPLTSYAAGKDVDFLDEGAIYLHSSGLGFAELPGISSLPKNTVICIRQVNAVASHFDKEEHQELFRRAEDVLVEILETAK